MGQPEGVTRGSRWLPAYMFPPPQASLRGLGSLRSQVGAPAGCFPWTCAPTPCPICPPGVNTHRPSLSVHTVRHLPLPRVRHKHRNAHGHCVRPHVHRKGYPIRPRARAAYLTHTHTHTDLPTPQVTALTSDRSPHTSTQIHQLRAPPDPKRTPTGTRAPLPHAHPTPVSPEGGLRFPALSGAARAGPSCCPGPGLPAAPVPTPGHKPRDCPPPAGCRPTVRGSRAQKGPLVGAPRAGWGDGGGFAGLSERGPRGRRGRRENRRNLGAGGGAAKQGRTRPVPPPSQTPGDRVAHPLLQGSTPGAPFSTRSGAVPLRSSGGWGWGAERAGSRI